MSSATEGFKALGSFHYFRGVDIAAFVRQLGPGYRFLADSGAYSALTQGATIKIGDYAAWLRKWQPYITHYINLDVIGDPAATWDNQLILEEEGLRPIPVFHAGSDFRHLYRYLDAGYTYICLGGLVGRTRKAVMPWAIKCFKEAKGKAVFHGLGLTRWADLAALPYYSVDSSSWGMGHRYGRMDLWDDRATKFRPVRLGTREVYSQSRLVRLHGGDPEKLSNRKNYTRADVCRVAATAYHLAERFLRRRHGPIEMPGDATPPGAHVYLADANIDDFQHGVTGLHMYLAGEPNGDFEKAAAGMHLYLADGSHDNLRLAATPTPSERSS